MITGATITDEQIAKLLGWAQDVVTTCHSALTNHVKADRAAAREKCAELIALLTAARGAQP